MEDFWGLVMTKPNVKIKNVTSLKDLDFHSDYPLLKIAFSGQGIIDISFDEWEAATGVVTINHSLGYKPRVLVRASIENGFINNDISVYFPVPYSAGSSSQGFWDIVSYEITTTQLIITFGGSGWTDPARGGYAYYIFYDEE